MWCSDVFAIAGLRLSGCDLDTEVIERLKRCLHKLCPHSFASLDLSGCRLVIAGSMPGAMTLIASSMRWLPGVQACECHMLHAGDGVLGKLLSFNARLVRLDISHVAGLCLPEEGKAPLPPNPSAHHY